MVLLILALLWVVLLAPVVVRRLRDGNSERSIEHFHAEHEKLSRQDYRVAPAHRLEVSETRPDRRSEPPASPRPRLTVVHADDTLRSLESRTTWREWQEDYEYDEPREEREPIVNRYARAYTSRPLDVPSAPVREPRLRRRSMRAQRRVVFLRLVTAALVATLAAVLVGYSPLVYLAVAAWLAVGLFIGLAFYAVSQGHLAEGSLARRGEGRARLAPVEPIYRDDYDHFASRYEPYDPDQQFDDPDFEWRREERRYRAYG